MSKNAGDERQEIVDYLMEKHGFDLIRQNSVEVSKIWEKIEDHKMYVSPVSIAYIIDTYGDEVLKPIECGDYKEEY